MLDVNSPLPLYYQLKTYIQEKILFGSWKPGDRIPSESEISAEFNISRTTTRQAIGELVSEGILNRKHGVGTFVALPLIEKRINKLTGFTQDMQARGLMPSSRVLESRITQPPEYVSRKLCISEIEPVIFMKRLRLADGAPMGIDIVYYPSKRFAGLLEEDLTDKSLYELLQNKYNTTPTRSEMALSAIACLPEYARHLEIPRGSPILQIERTTFDQNGKPFEQVLAIYRGDRYIFHTELFK
jgi:GntR family transcriptional regulator